MNKNIVIGLLVVIALVLGYLALKPKNAARTAPVTTTPVATTAPSPSPTQPSSVSVAGMQKYTDTSFGFSFWYPNTWTVTTPHNPPFGAKLTGVTVVATLGLQPAGQSYPSILIQEAQSTTRSITDTGGAGPIGPVTYFFDTATHLWMTTPPEGDGTTKAADISNNTMGGLHIFAGTSRFDTGIVPLSADNFVVIGDGGGANATALTDTVVALDPSVATPVSVDQQIQVVQKEETSIAH
jgi:hypothetical protein